MEKSGSVPVRVGESDADDEYEDLSTDIDMRHQKSVKSHSEISPTDITILCSADGETFLTDINQPTSPVRVDFEEQNATVYFTGSREDVDEARIKVEQFLKSKASITRQIKIQDGQLSLIKEKVKEIVGRSQIRVSYKGGPDASITISGTKDLVCETAELIEHMVKGIAEKWHVIRKPGLREMLEDKRKIALDTLQKKGRCVIEACIDETAGKADTRLELRRVKVNSGQDLVVVLGDLINEESDAIVNQANSSLEHNEGMAKKIVDAGGVDIQEESNKIIEKETGSLPVSSVVLTGAGELRCKTILHAIAPKWLRRASRIARRDRDKAQPLYNCVINILKEAKKQELKSVTIPAISYHLGFPLETCTSTIVGAVNEFFNDSDEVSITEITFISDTLDVCDAFLDAVSKVLGEEKDSASNPRSPKASRVVVYKEVDASAEGTINMEIGHLTVQLKSGNIMLENTEAVISITNEIEKVDYLSNTGVTLTSAVDLKEVSYNIHVVTHNGDTTEKLKQALSKADEKKIRSVSVPALGTGDADFGASKAHALFNAIGEFAATNPGHIRLVKVVIAEQNAFKTIAMSFRAVEGIPYVSQQFLADRENEKEVTQEMQTVPFHIFAVSSKYLDETVKDLENLLHTDLV